MSFLKNGVSAYAVKGIFNIKFKENFVVVGLVHEVTGVWTAASHPKRVPTPTWEGRRSLRSLGMKGLKQSLATRRR